MPNNLYITATEERSGKSVIVLGIMQMLKKELHRVAFFRPIFRIPLFGKVGIAVLWT